MENIIKFIQEDARIKLDFDPEKYELVTENGEFYLKKKIYPSIFMDAMEILKIDPYIETKYKESKVSTFQRLLIFRDAYWEAYSREHNFKNRWKPDFNDACQNKYAIVSIRNILTVKKDYFENNIFVFPSNEVACLFLENFKELLYNYF
jgi:hypothetical protein